MLLINRQNSKTLFRAVQNFPAQKLLSRRVRHTHSFQRKREDTQDPSKIEIFDLIKFEQSKEGNLYTKT
jgi:hypothetical protein